MARKKSFSPEQKAAMDRAGLDWRYYELVYDAISSMMVRNLQTDQTILVRKNQNPGRPGFRIPN